MGNKISSKRQASAMSAAMVYSGLEDVGGSFKTPVIVRIQP